jgi:Alginate export
VAHADDRAEVLPELPSFMRQALRAVLLALCAVIAPCLSAPTHGQEKNPTEAATAPERPVPRFNRWQEDWFVLADERVPRRPGDDFKYISLSDTDPLVYLSLGANLRERFEAFDAAQFGTSANRSSYVLSRLEVQSDLRLGPHVQIFAQLQSDFALGKEELTPVDQNRLDLEQAFMAVTESAAGGVLTLRMGRQQIAFDLQRFISVRDGPNVRQSYDAVWIEYEHEPWRFIALWSHPVQTRDNSPFDDYNSPSLGHGGIKLEWHVSPAISLSATWSRFIQDDAHFPRASGNESRDILDTHCAGAAADFDWDIEAMVQKGRISAQSIKAWAFGSLGGYTFTAVPWTPRLGLQVDTASGDGNPGDHILGTFNPLFPNGSYFSLSGLTGYANLIDVKTSITTSPSRNLTINFAVAAQWRQTTADAIYTAPDIPVAGTVGRGGRYTGRYWQFRLDRELSPNVAVSMEALHFAVGDAIKQAGGRDTDYLGVEIRFVW